MTYEPKFEAECCKIYVHLLKDDQKQGNGEREQYF